jgi:hypothetical protein
MLAVVLLVSAPLVWLNLRIERNGAQSVDVSSYDRLLSKIETDAAAVRQMRKREVDALASLKNTDMKPTMMVIVPETAPTNSGDAAAMEGMEIALSGIIWKPEDPLVIIGREIYRKGDEVDGCDAGGNGRISSLFPEGGLI